MKKNIILLGAPASGKGTFSEMILKLLPNIVHISTGDIFRDFLKENHPISPKIGKYLDEGSLIPDDIVIQEVKKILERPDVKEFGFIMDGFPRNMVQANFLSHYNIDLCLLLDVDEDLIKKRVLGRFGCPECNAIYNKYFLKTEKEGICDKCGAEIDMTPRSDDNIETFKKRLALYKEDSGPIIKYYNNLGL